MDATPSTPARDLTEIAVELRSAMTPVLGYLELLADEGAVPTEEQLLWIAALEDRVGSLQDLSRELASACTELRERSGSQAASASVRARNS